MNFWDRLEACKNDLTPAEMKVCEILEKNQYPFHTFSATKIAKLYRIPQASITRFVKKLGFESYSDFHLALVMSEKKIDSTVTEVKTTEQRLIENTSLVRQVATQPLLDKLSDLIIDSHHVFLCGTGNAYIPAYQLMIKLTSNEIQSTVIPPGFESQTLHTMDHEDIIIMYSHMNPTYKIFCESIKELPKEERPYTVLVYSTPNHPVRKLVDLAIELPTLVTKNTISQANEFPPINFNMFLTEAIRTHLRNRQKG